GPEARRPVASPREPAARRGGRTPRCFFFSSRRRHTRFSRDWSSDVCSSDLIPLGLILNEIFTDIKAHASINQSVYRKVEIRSRVNHTLLLIFVSSNVKSTQSTSALKRKSKISNELIEMLLRQLDGTWEVVDTPLEGTAEKKEVRITFTLKY